MDIFLNIIRWESSDTEDDLVRGEGSKFPDSDFSEVSKKGSEDETDGGDKPEPEDKQVNSGKFLINPLISGDRLKLFLYFYIWVGILS